MPVFVQIGDESDSKQIMFVPSDASSARLCALVAAAHGRPPECIEQLDVWSGSPAAPRRTLSTHSELNLNPACVLRVYYEPGPYCTLDISIDDAGSTRLVVPADWSVARTMRLLTERASVRAGCLARQLLVLDGCGGGRRLDATDDRTLDELLGDSAVLHARTLGDRPWKLTVVMDSRDSPQSVDVEPASRCSTLRTLLADALGLWPDDLHYSFRVADSGARIKFSKKIAVSDVLLPGDVIRVRCANAPTTVLECCASLADSIEA